MIMYHSITFGDKNTWTDWDLVPTSRPAFVMPEFKSQEIDLPGGNGSIDVSMSLTGYPLYQNRKGTFEFIVVNDTYAEVEIHKPWQELYSEIANYLHGKKMKAVLEDDPDWYYEGYFTLDSWENGEHYSTVTIGYNVGPFKWYKDETEFIDNYVGNTYRHWRTTDEDYGKIPVMPTFTVGSTSGTGMMFHWTNRVTGVTREETYVNGTFSIPDFVLYGPETDLRYHSVSASGTFKAVYRKGSL